MRSIPRKYNCTKKKLLLIILFCSGFSLMSPIANAQQTLNVSGHSVKIDDITFDYSIGEMTIISTERTSNLIITQGVLQPDATIFAADPSETDGALSTLDNPIKVYPNPVNNLVIVESYETAIQDYAYNLYDATGKIVLSQKGQTRVGTNKWELNVQSLASGSYYLMIQKNDTSGQAQNYSFKIQKIN